MNKIWLITQREFSTRVKKKSFIVMSVLGPLLFAGFITTMAFLAGSKDTEVKRIAIIDSTGLFFHKITETQSLKFDYLNENLEKTKLRLSKSPYYGILFIHPRITYSQGGAQFYSFQQPSIAVVQHISDALEKELRDQKLKAYKIENIDNILKSVETHVGLQTIKMSESGEEKSSNTTLAMIVAYVGSFLIYMFILGYGVQVMRGVIEEKTNRIVEVIISSVKPFQLMMGKVLGVAMAALTQFGIWIALSLIFFIIAKSTFLPDISAAHIAPPPQNLMESTHTMQQIQVPAQPMEVNSDLAAIFNAFDYIRFGVMIGSFLIYFIGGYLLYSSLFAAVGAAVDSDTDTQQFVLPITLPLILGLLVMIRAFQYPDDPIAFWFSMIPFTSPIVMMARIPFGVPQGQVIVSMLILVATFIGTIWLAGKIYRTGILMYGKKVSFKEMFKWLRYKN
jgi:ABC-2 type transport system permease protein